MKGDRDRLVEQLLRRSLDDPGAPESDSCLDAETLAAWIDGGLDERALMMAEVHAAACARCQALVGAMARSAPDAPTFAPWWRREWHFRWLVPLTASAAAVALWMIVPGERPASQLEKHEESQIRAEALPPATLAAPPLADQSAPAAPASPVLTDRLQTQAPVAARERRDASASTSTRASKDEATGLPKAPETPGRAALSGPRPQAPGPTPRANERDLAALAETVTVQRKALADAGADVEITSPDPAIRWRLGPAGTVGYSTDGGSTWEPLSTGASTRLTAGSSPSAPVCWLVGRGGIVLLTTDGRRWRRVPFPEAVDLGTVRAADARTAAVTTTDGRTFRTEDAGQTWIRVAPQGF